MENNIIHTTEPVSYAEMTKRVRRCKVATDIFIILLGVIFFGVCIGAGYCMETGYEFSTAQLAQIFIALFSHTLLVAFVFSCIMNENVEACFDHYFVCKECGHVHAISNAERAKTNNGYALCPECKALTKHKKLCRVETVAHSATEETV